MYEIGRRGLIQSVLLLAGVASAPRAGARALFGGPASLPQDTMGLLTAFADTMIPATDTPGAADVGVPVMFDKLLANWASASRRSQLLGALEAVDAEASKVSGSGFATLLPARRLEVLLSFDKGHAGDAGYAKLRELVITLYYLTEAGSTVELRYEHAPGKWEPSIPVTAETRNYGGPAAA